MCISTIRPQGVATENVTSSTSYAEAYNRITQLNL